MTSDEQLRAWVEGNPMHRGQRPDGECVPDFSCCRPSLLQPREIREAFAAADARGRQKFLMSFLGAMIAEAAPDTRVHIAGRDQPED